MARFIVYRWHRKNSKGIIKLREKTDPVAVIKEGQQIMREQGFNDAISWKLYDGDLVGAMVETTKI